MQEWKRFFAVCAAALMCIAAVGGLVQAAQTSRFMAAGAEGVAQAFAPATRVRLPQWLKTAAGYAPPPFGLLYWIFVTLKETWAH